VPGGRFRAGRRGPRARRGGPCGGLRPPRLTPDSRSPAAGPRAGQERRRHGERPRARPHW
jgi:hypothetical protein